MQSVMCEMFRLLPLRLCTYICQQPPWRLAYTLGHARKSFVSECCTCCKRRKRQLGAVRACSMIHWQPWRLRLTTAHVLGSRSQDSSQNKKSNPWSGARRVVPSPTVAWEPRSGRTSPSGGCPANGVPSGHCLLDLAIYCCFLTPREI